MTMPWLFLEMVVVQHRAALHACPGIHDRAPAADGGSRAPALLHRRHRTTRTPLLLPNV